VFVTIYWTTVFYYNNIFNLNKYNIVVNYRRLSKRRPASIVIVVDQYQSSIRRYNDICKLNYNTKQLIAQVGIVNNISVVNNNKLEI